MNNQEKWIAFMTIVRREVRRLCVFGRRLLYRR